MRVPWMPLLLGLACAVGGGALAAHGWGEVLAAGPGAAGVVALGAGVLLALLGILMVVVPLLVPVLYRLHGPAAFVSRAAACPVVSKCGRCGEFNFRGRAACKQCAAPLVWEAAPPQAPSP